MTWDEAAAHLAALAVASLLFGAYWLFRRYYIRALQRAMYSPADGPAVVAPATATSGASSLVLRWVDAGAWAARSEPAAAAAWREAAAARTAYMVSGAFLVVLAFLVIYAGLRHNGYLWRGAVVVAFLNTFVGLILVLIFVRPTWRVSLLTITAWVATYFGLTVGVVETSWTTAAAVLTSNVLVTMSLPSLIILPFASRAMRPLVVAFIPFLTLLATVATAMALVFDLLDLTLTGRPTARAVVGGALAAVFGMGLVVHQIRRGVRPAFVVIWLAGLTAAALALWRTGHMLAATALGVFTHGLFVLVTWSLMRLFLRLKRRGCAPSETLHYIGCCALFSMHAAIAAQPSWARLPLPASALLAALVVLYVLLGRHPQPREARQRMLFLRVFGQTPVRSWLMDLLDDTWRRIGRIDTVVGLDLALHTLNALALEDFLRGRIHRQFVKHAFEVPERVASLPSRRSVDRRYPLNELHCLPDSWQPVVRALLQQADVVLIDVRGLRAENHGALFELDLAVRIVPLQRLVLIADPHTERTLVERVVHAAWSAGENGRPTPPAAPELVVWVVTRFSHVVAQGITNAVFAAARTPRGVGPWVEARAR